MREHLKEWWWLYLVALGFAGFIGAITVETVRQNNSREACLLQGRVPLTGYGRIYCVDPRALDKPHD